MKKIITLFDVQNTPWHVLSFAIKIAKQNSLPVTGVFLQYHKRSDQKYPFPSDLGLTKGKLSDEFISHENDLLTDDNINLFKDECENAGVNFEINKAMMISDVISKSAQDELIIADTRAPFLDELLPGISTPICLTSEDDLPRKLVLLLDEGNSSRNAIKTFAATLPQLTSLPAEVVSINLNEQQSSENEMYVTNNLQGLFPSLTIQRLVGNVEKTLLKFLNDKQDHVMVVMGAFGRSQVSRFFKDSLANVILENTRLSLFIVHK
jgi:nucleotide-binding universal stress UspA family protein